MATNKKPIVDFSNPLASSQRIGGQVTIQMDSLKLKTCDTSKRLINQFSPPTFLPVNLIPSLNSDSPGDWDNGMMSGENDGLPYADTPLSGRFAKCDHISRWLKSLSDSNTPTFTLIPRYCSRHYN